MSPRRARWTCEGGDLTAHLPVHAKLGVLASEPNTGELVVYQAPLFTIYTRARGSGGGPGLGLPTTGHGENWWLYL